MIFDSEDIPRLNRIVIRKGCETAMVTLDASLSESQRRIKIDELVRQIARARIMTSIGNNDVADLGDQIPLLEEGMSFMPSGMMESYLSGLSDRDREDESCFLWMMGVLLSQMPLLKEAVKTADFSGPGCGIDENDMHCIRVVLSIIRTMEERCNGQDPEVLGGAVPYMNAVKKQCSILIRIKLLKPVSSEEISALTMMLGTVSEEDFDRLFIDLLRPDQKVALEYFRESTGRYISAMYARCILNSRYPETSEMR